MLFDDELIDGECRSGALAAVRAICVSIVTKQRSSLCAWRLELLHEQGRVLRGLGAAPVHLLTTFTRTERVRFRSPTLRCSEALGCRPPRASALATIEPSFATTSSVSPSSASRSSSASCSESQTASTGAGSDA